MSNCETLFFEIESEIATLQKKLHPTEKRTARLKNLAEALRGGKKVSDFQFDQIYPSTNPLDARGSRHPSR